MTTDLIGKKFGDYTLTELLGQGGMATVYRGYQESIDRSVAVKVLPAEHLNDPHFSKRFILEARTLSKLSHPAIVSLYAFGEHEGMSYIVMPLMSGGSLADRLKNGALSLQETERIFTRIAEALDFAHQQNILHRDIKPNNILFDQLNNPYLSDFGIAKSTEAASTSSLTGTGIVGTPDYMSPEQARGEQVDARSDIYALGVVAYQMLTGEVLFKATTPLGVIFKHISEPPPIMRMYRPEIPDNVESVVFKALEKEPSNRYRTASEFARALTGAIKTPDKTPEPATVIPPTVRDSSSIPTRIEHVRPVVQPVAAPTVSAPPRAAEKKSGGMGWVFAIIGIVGVIGICLCGLFFVVSVGASSTASTAQARTALAVSDLTSVAEDKATSTAQAQIATSTARARATALAQVTATSPRAESTAAALARLSSAWAVSLSTNFDSTAPQWPLGNYNETQTTAVHALAGGKYRWTLTMTSAMNWRAGPTMNPLSDSRLSADVKRVSGPASSNYGVFFRYDSTNNEMYVFYINDLQHAGMYRYSDNQWTTLLDRSSVTAIVPGDTNRIVAIVQGSRFTFFINNQYVGEATDTRLTKGHSGLIVGMDTDSGVFDFDNVEIRVP